MKTSVKVIIGVVVLLVVLGGVGAYVFLKDDAPAEVNLDTALESVTTTTAGVDGAGVATSDGIEGSWTIDTDTGEFDFESATGTFAGFRIQEELSSIGSTTAVGRTGDVTGSLTIEGTTLTAATFEVDLTTITTNESRRNSQVQKALETSQFPKATFTLTQPVDLGAAAAEGQAISVQAVGDLTIHGVTKQVTMPIDAKLEGGTIVATGSTDISFADYGVEVPSAAIVVSVEDHGVVEVQLLFTKA